MANTNSTLVANELATPTVLTESSVSGGFVQIASDNVELVAADFDADGDTIHMVDLPSDAIIHSLKVSTDDLDTSTDVSFNYGIYSTDLATIHDEDFFASLITAQATSRLTELFDEAVTAANRASPGKKLFELAGIATDPGGRLAIVATQTATAASAAAGTFSFQISYSVR